MRSLSLIASLFLAAGSAYAQGSAVFTPTQRDLSVPTYINATVVSVNAGNQTVRFRSASGEVSLAVDSQKVRDLGRLRAGDQVVLGYTVDERTGRPARIVSASLAGEELASRGQRTASTSSLSTISGRVVSTNPSAGTMVISDALGRTETLSVQGSSARTSLGMVRRGDQVNVAFTPSAAAGRTAVGGTAVGGVFGTVNGIQPAGSPTFVTGSIAAVDANTGAVTLRTQFGEQMFMLPPSGVNAGSLRVGQDVRLDLSGRAGDRSFTTLTPLGGMSSTGIVGSTFATPGVTAGARAGVNSFTTGNLPAPGGTTVGAATIPGSAGRVGGGIIPGTAGIAGVGTIPPTTGNFAGTLPSAVGAIPGSPTSGAGFNSPLGNQVNPGGAAGVNNAGVNNGGINSGNAATGANTANSGNSATGGNNANGGLGGNTGTLSFPASPFASTVPSLPSAMTQLNVVPPPAAAPAGVADQLPVGAMRDIATRDYDHGVHTMALKANEIDAHWFRYRDGCLRSSSTSAEIDRGLYGGNRDREWYVLFSGDVRTPADDNCRQLVIEMTRMADDWRNNMTRIEDAARRNDVLPGAMREVRQRYRVDF